MGVSKFNFDAWNQNFPMEGWASALSLLSTFHFEIVLSKKENCKSSISRQGCQISECVSSFWLRQSFIFCLERRDRGSIHKDKLHFTDKLMNKIPDICFLLFAICYGLHWGGIQTFRHPRFQKPQKVRFSLNANGVYFYSFLCVGPLASLLNTPKNVFFLDALEFFEIAFFLDALEFFEIAFF